MDAALKTLLILSIINGSMLYVVGEYHPSIQTLGTPVMGQKLIRALASPGLAATTSPVR